MANYGTLTEKEWDSCKDKMFQVLQRVASQGQTISYSALSSELPIPIDPHGNEMRGMLGQVSTEEDSCGRGMLSVIVVHKEGDKMPGKGFFDCAAGLSRDVSDRERLWISEINRVYKEWGNR